MEMAVDVLRVLLERDASVLVEVDERQAGLDVQLGLLALHVGTVLLIFLADVSLVDLAVLHDVKGVEVLLDHHFQLGVLKAEVVVRVACAEVLFDVLGQLGQLCLQISLRLPLRVITARRDREGHHQQEWREGGRASNRPSMGMVRSGHRYLRDRPQRVDLMVAPRNGTPWQNFGFRCSLAHSASEPIQARPASTMSHRRPVPRRRE